MSLVKQGGQVMTTRGLREPRPPLCENCGERKNSILIKNANGKFVCADCAGKIADGVLRQECDDPDNCACGEVKQTEDEASSD